MKDLKFSKIKLLVVDVDGVLSDGRIIYDSQGSEYKIFHAHDGLGIRMAQEAGVRIAFVSSRYSSVVDRRARELGVEIVYQNVSDKAEVLEEIIKTNKIKLNETCVVGDDVIDIPILEKAGISVAVANAVSELKTVADYTTKLPGGKGAIREVVDLILEAKGKKNKNS